MYGSGAPVARTKFPPLAPEAHQIRLLSLAHGQSSDIVRCTLYTVDLSDAPPFDALSYTWGDPSITKAIQINNADFQATANLEAFLRQRQTEKEQRPLWIDAICINQGDAEEKTTQVLRMADVYERCTWLTVWLGPGTMESDLAVHNVKKAAKGEIFWGSGDEEDRATRALLELPWWKRVWIVQEIAFGAKGGDHGFRHWDNKSFDDKQTRLTYGSTSMGWELLVRAAVNIADAINTSQSLKSLLSSRVHALDYGRTDVSLDYQPGYSPLLLTLSQFRDRHSKDPRDKAFALLRMAPRVRGDILQPDYNASFNSVLRRVVQREVSVTQTLNILRYCQRQSERASCSWAPDWSKAAEETILQGMVTAVHAKPEVRFSDDLQSLRVRAIIWDAIDVILNLPTAQDVEGSYGIEFLIDLCESRQFIRQTLSTSLYGSEDDRVNAFWQTLFGEFFSIDRVMGDCLGYAGPVSCLEWLPSLPKHWRPPYERAQNVEEEPERGTWISRGVDLPNKPFGIQVADPFKHRRTEGILAATGKDKSSAMLALKTAALRRFRHVIGRKLFVTKKGYIGLGPPDCAMNDPIVVMLSAEVPFVLRSHGEHYQLIGETYVRGIIFGQVTDKLKKGEVDTSDVTLR